MAKGGGEDVARSRGEGESRSRREGVARSVGGGVARSRVVGESRSRREGLASDGPQHLSAAAVVEAAKAGASQRAAADGRRCRMRLHRVSEERGRGVDSGEDRPQVARG